MFGAKDNFDARLHRVERSKHGPEKGYHPVIEPDGLIVVRKRNRGGRFPIRGLVYLAFGVILFKSIALVQFGAQGYSDRIETMRQGTIVEQAGAWVMQADRISLLLADKLRPLLR